MTARPSPRGGVLALNCGSSTVKHALFVDGVASARGEMAWDPSQEGEREEHLTAMLAPVGRADTDGPLLAIAHRMVHGGPTRSRPALVDDALVDELRAVVPFAPVHLPTAIACLEASRARFPGVPHVVCFDTDFHRALPESVTRYPIARALFDRGICRYGFHGLSFEHVLDSLGTRVPERLVIAHLGSGASLAAVLRGICVDTTMGFSPAGGLVMATRTGDLDPGLLLHLMRAEGFDLERLEAMITRTGGLLALSGTTGDMRTLLSLADRDPRAELAIHVFCRKVQQGIAAMTASLGGIDRLIFTGGIGAGAGVVRARILAGLDFLRIPMIAVVETDEERVMARHALAVLESEPT